MKVSVSEGRRPEEESSFWKISAERSRLEGEKADFQSLTPSQIKSLEKGEKPLPSYLRQVSAWELLYRYCWLQLLMLKVSTESSFRRVLSSPRSLKRQSPTLQFLQSPSSPEHRSLPPRSPLSPCLWVQHLRPSPSHQCRLSPPRLRSEAGRDLRARCHPSAIPRMKSSLLTWYQSLPSPPPPQRRKTQTKGPPLWTLALPLPRWVLKRSVFQILL